MKKKILSVCLVAVIAVTAIAGASLAYFTDTDDATNVFTVGGVKIALNEQQRNEAGTALEAFENDKVLMPIVGSAQGAKDKFGLSTAENYVDKIVTVKNTGASEAFVRVFVAIPSALQAETAAKNPLHWNTGNKFTAAGDYDTTATNKQPEHADYNEKCVWADVGTATIDGIAYDVCSFTYTDALAAGDETDYAAFVGFYLDKTIDARVVTETVNGETVEKTVYSYIPEGGEVTDIDFDFSNGVTIPVVAQAVQSAGFDTAAEAFAASGLAANPWA